MVTRGSRTFSVSRSTSSAGEEVGLADAQRGRGVPAAQLLRGVLRHLVVEVQYGLGLHVDTGVPGPVAEGGIQPGEEEPPQLLKGRLAPVAACVAQHPYSWASAP